MSNPIMEIKNLDAPVRKLKLLWDGFEFTVVEGLLDHEDFACYPYGLGKESQKEIYEFFYKQRKGVQHDFIFMVEVDYSRDESADNCSIVKIYSIVPIEYEIECKIKVLTEFEMLKMKLESNKYAPIEQAMQTIIQISENSEQKER